MAMVIPRHESLNLTCFPCPLFILIVVVVTTARAGVVVMVVLGATSIYKIQAKDDAKCPTMYKTDPIPTTKKLSGPHY